MSLHSSLLSLDPSSFRRKSEPLGPTEIKYGFLYNWWATQGQDVSGVEANANVWDGTNNAATVNILGVNEIPFNVYANGIKLTLNQSAQTYAELGEYEYLIFTQDGVYHFITVKTTEGEILNTMPNGYVVLNRVVGYSIINPVMASLGWSIPSDFDYGILANYYNDYLTLGGYLKDTGYTYWKEPNTGAFNGAGFNARGGGKRQESTGLYVGLKELTISPFTSDSMLVGGVLLEYNTAEILIQEEVDKTTGFSLRLVRPATEAEQLLPDGPISAQYIGNDDKAYRCTKIGTQVWLADNLAETKWSNGNYIPIVENDNLWAALLGAACCAFDNNYSNVPISYNPSISAIVSWYGGSALDFNFFRLKVNGDIVNSTTDYYIPLGYSINVGDIVRVELSGYAPQYLYINEVDVSDQIVDYGDGIYGIELYNVENHMDIIIEYLVAW